MTRSGKAEKYVEEDMYIFAWLFNKGYMAKYKTVEW